MRDEIVEKLPREWATLNDVAKLLYGPTHRVFSAGRYREVETTASGSGIETVLDTLVREGEAEVRSDWRVPMGKRYRKSHA